MSQHRAQRRANDSQSRSDRWQSREMFAWASLNHSSRGSCGMMGWLVHDMGQMQIQNHSSRRDTCPSIPVDGRNCPMTRPKRVMFNCSRSREEKRSFDLQTSTPYSISVEMIALQGGIRYSILLLEKFNVIKKMHAPFIPCCRLS